MSKVSPDSLFEAIVQRVEEYDNNPDISILKKHMK